MNTFVLLPYFLLSRITDVPNTEISEKWPYGPEYTYNVDIYVNSPVELFYRNQGFNVSTVLRCRPQESDMLNCRLDDIKMAMIESSEPSKVQEGNINLSNDKPFQLKFDNKGIKELVVGRDRNQWSVDTIRGIVSHLNIGVDLQNRTDDVFRDMERSHMGECMVNVNITRETPDSETTQTQNFEIVPTSWIRKARGEVVTIEKIKDMSNCTYLRNYSTPGMPNGLNVDMKTANTQYVISDTSYEACTYIQANIQFGSVINWSLDEKICLNLISVLPAVEPLPEITDPITVGLNINDNN